MHAWEAAEGETNAFAAPGRSGAMVIPQDVLELRAARVKTVRQRSQRGTSAVCPLPSRMITRNLVGRQPRVDLPRPRQDAPLHVVEPVEAERTRGRGTPRATETPTCSAPTGRRRGAARRPPP